MWEGNYAQEPFDFPLFVIRIISNWYKIVITALITMLVVGGGYYLSKVTFGGVIPYNVTVKYYVEYEIDPNTQISYSYLSAYTWNDWMKSQDKVDDILIQLSHQVSREELLASYEVMLPSDVRIPYISVTHKDSLIAKEISEALTAVMITFGGTQKELESIAVIDTIGPTLVYPDVRTMRACVLGAVIGTFFSMFIIGLQLLIDQRIYVPTTFTYRYHIPMLGFPN